jgi:hypothetical protein
MADEFIGAGFGGYDEKSHYPKGTSFQTIPKDNIHYDDFEQLGIDR